MKNIILVIVLALTSLCSFAQPAGCGYSFTTTDNEFTFEYSTIYLDGRGGKDVIDGRQPSWRMILPTCMSQENSYIVTCSIDGEEVDRFVLERLEDGTLDVRHTGTGMVAIAKR